MTTIEVVGAVGVAVLCCVVLPFAGFKLFDWLTFDVSKREDHD